MRFPPLLLCTDNVGSDFLPFSAAALTSEYIGFSAVIGCRQKTPCEQSSMARDSFLIQEGELLKNRGNRAFAVAAPNLWNNLPVLNCSDSRNF